VGAWEEMEVASGWSALLQVVVVVVVVKAGGGTVEEVEGTAARCLWGVILVPLVPWCCCIGPAADSVVLQRDYGAVEGGWECVCAVIALVAVGGCFGAVHLARCPVLPVPQMVAAVLVLMPAAVPAQKGLGDQMLGVIEGPEQIPPVREEPQSQSEASCRDHSWAAVAGH
jgi:hypothetical protein